MPTIYDGVLEDELGSSVIGELAGISSLVAIYDAQLPQTARDRSYQQILLILEEQLQT